jgi:hypothetical protein
MVPNKIEVTPVSPVPKIVIDPPAAGAALLSLSPSMIGAPS